MEKQKLIIVGAGVSGLVMANILAPHFDITILEGNNRPGGRICSRHEPEFGGIIEYGPEFIHGNAANTIKLLKEAGIDYIQLTGKMFRYSNGKMMQENNIMEHWDVLMEKMKEADSNITFHAFLAEHFSDAKYADLRKQAKAYAEGFDLADINDVTTASLYEEWSHEDEPMYRIPGGYTSLITYLADNCEKQGCNIIYNTAAEQIEWMPDDVTVHCNNNAIYQSHKIAITSPIGLMRNDEHRIHFNPEIAVHTQALKGIGWGHVIKVIIAFEEAFWKDDIGFIFSDQLIPTWWTMIPDKRPVWTGWVGGKTAKELAVHSDEEILDHAIASLGTLLDVKANVLKANVTAYKIMNWQNSPWTRGGYSYSIPASAASRRILKTPVERTIFFAGEGLYSGPHPGTVEAAIAGAKEIAGNILATGM